MFALESLAVTQSPQYATALTAQEADLAVPAPSLAPASGSCTGAPWYDVGCWGTDVTGIVSAVGFIGAWLSWAFHFISSAVALWDVMVLSVMQFAFLTNIVVTMANGVLLMILIVAAVKELV